MNLQSGVKRDGPVCSLHALGGTLASCGCPSSRHTLLHQTQERGDVQRTTRIMMDKQRLGIIPVSLHVIDGCLLDSRGPPGPPTLLPPRT